MGEHCCYLITVTYDHEMTGPQLMQCALKIKCDDVPENVDKYLLEKDSKEWFHKQLPLHVANCGPVVHVETIFECRVVE